MDDVRDLQALQLDALREVANIGPATRPPRSGRWSTAGS